MLKTLAKIRKIDIKKIRDSIVTWHFRPKFSKDIHTWSDALKNEPLTAIVIQGPLLLDMHFTLETVRAYRKIFKKAQIIVSTWEGESTEEIDSIKKEGAEIILNKKPSFLGQQNINLQIVSSFSGVKKAKEMGAKFVLKSRTDQRMYAINSMDFLRNTLEAFPLKGPATAQKKRIIGVSLNTYKYRPYGLSDMTIFGTTEDMMLYWGAPQDDRKIAPEELSGSTGRFAKARVCEIYLVTEFLKKIGYTPKGTIEDSWTVFSRYLCVVDQQSLNLYWYKNKHREYKDLQYEYVRNSQTMTFSEWLNLYIDPSNKLDVPEKTLETPFTSVIES